MQKECVVDLSLWGGSSAGPKDKDKGEDEEEQETG